MRPASCVKIHCSCRDQLFAQSRRCVALHIGQAVVYVSIRWGMVYVRYGFGEFKRSAVSSVAAREFHNL